MRYTRKIKNKVKQILPTNYSQRQYSGGQGPPISMQVEYTMPLINKAQHLNKFSDSTHENIPFLQQTKT